MTNHVWADYPFPLISTPALSDGYSTPYVKSATKMAIVHNAIIRGMNCMYLQCENVRVDRVPDFLKFCQAWSQFLHCHHDCEEVAYFPAIEKACGIEGISDTNVEQHEAFMPGLTAFDCYIYGTHSYDFSGKQLIDLLDNFCATLQMHLTDEILWILSLEKYPKLNLTKIDYEHGLYVRAHQSKTRILPYLLSNHDHTYEEGLHKWWPPNGPVRDFFLRYICSLLHRGAWEFSSCTLGGYPKTLTGAAALAKLEEVKVDDRDHPSLEMLQSPTKLPKAVTRSHTGSSSLSTLSRSSTSRIVPWVYSDLD